MEKIGKHIAKFSTRPGLDNISFFETALLSFLTGNADMHLKNFSLLTTADNDIILSPAYDLVCTKLAMPEDKDEMGLTINGKKRRLRKTDFDTLAGSLKIPEKTMQNSYERFAKKLPAAFDLVDSCFLPEASKTAYKAIIAENAEKLGIG